MSSHLGPLSPLRRDGAEPFVHEGDPVGTLAGFWSWACSDLASNTMRGVLAEYLVATALGAADGTRTEWDSVDIRTPEHGSVEVKYAAYLQSWHQDALSKISFSIAPAAGWDFSTAATSTEVRRHADVYVFCLLHHQDKRSLDPLDLGQWTFYVLPTRVLDEHHPGQKTIALSSLKRLNPTEVGFAGLSEAVTACSHQEGRSGPT